MGVSRQSKISMKNDLKCSIFSVAESKSFFFFTYYWGGENSCEYFSRDNLQLRETFMIAKFTLNTSSLFLAITCGIFHKLGRFSKKKKRLFLGVLRFFFLGYTS